MITWIKIDPGRIIIFFNKISYLTISEEVFLIEKRFAIKSLKTDVVKAAKWIFHKGLVDIGEGNVSVRIPNKDELLITPTFNDYENLTEKEIVHLGFEEKKIN